MLMHPDRGTLGCSRFQRGVSLVELLVGITVGLFVAAAAGMLVSTQLSDNRRLLVEVQLQQDLRSAADIISREVRRAGQNLIPERYIWAATAPGAPLHTAQPNPSAVVSTVGTQEVQFIYHRRAGEVGPFGFRWDTSGQSLRTQLTPDSWQELTDPRTLRITALTITPVDEPAIPLPCPKLCSDGTTACWPSYVVRAFRVRITGEATADSAVQRTLQTTVRLRNDHVQYNDTAAPTRLCPA